MSKKKKKSKKQAKEKRKKRKEKKKKVTYSNQTRKQANSDTIASKAEARTGLQEAPAQLIPEPWPRLESPGDVSGTRRILANRPQVGRAAGRRQFFFPFSVGVVGSCWGAGAEKAENPTGAATGPRTTRRLSSRRLSSRETRSQCSGSRAPRPHPELGKLSNSSECSYPSDRNGTHLTNEQAEPYPTGAVDKNPRVGRGQVHLPPHPQPPFVQAAENRSS